MIAHNIYKVILNLHLDRFLYFYKKTEQYYIFHLFLYFLEEFGIVRGILPKKSRQMTGRIKWYFF